MVRIADPQHITEAQKAILNRRLRLQSLQNERRFEVLMNSIRRDIVRTTQNSKDLDAWFAKMQGKGNTNIFLTNTKISGEIQKIVDNISKAVTSASYMPSGANAEIIKGVISENTMHYVTNMGEDLKQQMRKIAVESYNQKLAPREIAKRLSKEIDGMTKTRAKVIARTETMRGGNLANYAQAKQKGATAFRVMSDEGLCELCEEIYHDGDYQGPDNETWYPIDSGHLMPPAHPNCRCVPDFTYRPVEDL